MIHELFPDSGLGGSTGTPPRQPVRLAPPARHGPSHLATCSPTVPQLRIPSVLRPRRWPTTYPPPQDREDHSLTQDPLPLQAATPDLLPTSRPRELPPTRDPLCPPTPQMMTRRLFPGSSTGRPPRRSFFPPSSTRCPLLRNLFPILGLEGPHASNPFVA